MGLKERRQREKEERKSLILKAAKELLLKRGITGTSMNQIAAEAELGVATLYSYFKNKEELFLIIQKEGQELLYEKCLKASKNITDPREKLRRYAATYLDFSVENRNYYCIINHFISSPEMLFSPGMKSESDERAARNLELNEKAIIEGIEQGLFQEVEIKRCALIFWGIIHSTIQFKKFEMTLLKNDDYSEFFNYSVERFIQMLMVPGNE
ncbi:MAG: TetR/AcrR family transcriptional regulator [Deltaproteobacteria bacterium]|jgi:AcrR family transcriptional regulator|nr:TetR/AcrR family transcriptional regulator [Deltaproteobacteria bacterium]MBT4644295.1 TetR/AcrR family transcriptional regulator [Deltaproteobacteria bacterium]MBT6500363.1 TetR/AcrR family transcriptional regulator [Deltaproteobacteria bacterium]MBT6615299.1 TetR/AcrR family transcriptional regulator [Deltaproteobacteria bacterium]MBT7151114.1 TetR/AcrR family transcriptional regulator [Deltaproteobacteria bacterium]